MNNPGKTHYVGDNCGHIQGEALAKAEAEVTRLREALGEVALPCHDYDCDERPAIALAALKEASQ
jgi:hypothetical protein